MRKLIMAVALLGATGAAQADEVSELKVEAKALQKQNEQLNKRLADIERRQRLLDARAADLSAPAKAPYGKAPPPVDDAVCYKGICLYGVIDAGYGWQAHGSPYSPFYPAGDNYWITKQNNRSLFLAAPNGLSQSTIGLKGSTELLPGLSGIFKVETGFSPLSGTLGDGQKSAYQQNGIPLASQITGADSSRNGQAFNGQAYVGLSSPLYGTVTVGRNNSLLLDQILAYDPLGASYAFSVLGTSGTFAGGGSTEFSRLDQSIKWTWIYGPVHAGAIYQVGNYGNSGNSTWVHDDVQGDAGFTYLGLSVDGVGGHARGVIVGSPLTAAQQTTAITTFGNANTLSTSVSDNTFAIASAKYRFDGPVKWELMGGYEWIQFAKPSNPVAAGFLNTYGTQFSVVNNAAYPNDRVLQIAWIGGKWQATDHLVVQTGYYHYWQNSYGDGSGTWLSGAKLAAGQPYTGLVTSGLGPKGCSSNAFASCSGTVDSVSLVLDYVFTKHFDVYAGAMYSHASGGLAAGFLNNWTVDPTVGARYSF